VFLHVCSSSFPPLPLLGPSSAHHPLDVKARSAPSWQCHKSVISVAKPTHSLCCNYLPHPLSYQPSRLSLAASDPCHQISQYTLSSNLRSLKIVRRTRPRTSLDLRKLKHGPIILRSPNNGIDFLPILLPRSSTPYGRVYTGLG